MSPEFALQTWLVETLRTDAGVRALVGDNVVDVVPNDKQPIRPPYLLAGRIASGEEPAGCGRVYRITQRFYAASGKFGRDEAWAIVHAARQALRGKVPQLIAPFAATAAVEPASANDIIEPERIHQAAIDVVALVAEDTED